MPPFKVESEFVPTGDQPKAIEALVKGLEEGARLQTLLGATGTGKSVTHGTDIYVVEESGAQRTARVMPIGDLIDGLMREHDGSVRVENDNEILDAALSRQRYYVHSFDPDSGAVGLYPVSAFTRHATPDHMYHVETACGRSATMTGDHNLWVLRDGRLTLIESADARLSDYLPLPERLPEVAGRQVLDALAYVPADNVYVQATSAIRQHLELEGADAFNAVIERNGLSASAKRYANRHETRGSGIAVGVFRELLAETEQLGGHYSPAEARVGGKGQRATLSAELPLTPSLLRFLGAYVAEGCAGHEVAIITTHAPTIREAVRDYAAEQNLTCAEYVPGELRIFSTALAAMLKRLCGADARSKRLPEVWAELPDESLATLLRAYFDGDGTVDRALAISATTASEQLASDLCYALLRFGIWARISKRWKRATNAAHEGDWYYQVTLSGQADLRRFARQIGFSIESKQAALLAHLGREENSNVDVVPIDGRELRALRGALGLLAREVAARAGLSRSGLQLIETNERRPQRATLARVLDALGALAVERRVDPAWWERYESLRRLCTLRWTPIASITPVDYDHPHVYDVTVPGAETFLAGRGGMFVHNTFVVAKVVERVQKPTLVLAHNKTLAAQLYAEFKEFFPHNAVEYFVSYYDYYQPEAYVAKSDLFIEKDSSINDEINRLRLAATQALFTRQDVLIVASVSAIYGLGSPEDYGRVAVELKRGETRKRDRLLRHLIDIHYERNDFDLKRGTFRVRGDTLEVMPAYDEAAYRVEFWDDEVERITEVDALTGEIIREHVSLDIYPAKHFITPDDKLNEAIYDIEAELEQRLTELRLNEKLLEAQRLEQRTRYDLEMLREIGYCSGVENYSRPLSRRPPGSTPWTLLDYFPDDYLMVVDESHMTLPQVRGMFNGDRARKEVLVEYGFRLPSALDNRPLRWDEFEKTIPQTLFISATPGPYEREHSEQIVRQVIRPTGILDPVIVIRPSKGQVDDLVAEVNARIGRGERTLVTTLTKRMAEDLADYLADLGIKVHYLHSEIQTLERVEILRELRLGVYDVVVGINLLREGLDLPEVSLVAILDADKEGFLRSDSALIQTMGRAARHPDGVVIMYADVITASMQRAIDEVEARRAIQEAYNKEHGIEPHAIAKAVHDLTERVKLAEAPEAYDATALASLPADELTRMIEDLERQMRAAAQELAFERAAQLRDQINDLRIVVDASDTRPEWVKIREQQREEAAAERALAKQTRKRGVRYDT